MQIEALKRVQLPSSVLAADGSSAFTASNAPNFIDLPRRACAKAIEHAYHAARTIADGSDHLSRRQSHSESCGPIGIDPAPRAAAAHAGNPVPQRRAGPQALRRPHAGAMQLPAGPTATVPPESRESPGRVRLRPSFTFGSPRLAPASRLPLRGKACGSWGRRAGAFVAVRLEIGRTVMLAARRSRKASSARAPENPSSLLAPQADRVLSSLIVDRIRLPFMMIALVVLPTMGITSPRDKLTSSSSPP